MEGWCPDGQGLCDCFGSMYTSRVHWVLRGSALCPVLVGCAGVVYQVAIEEMRLGCSTGR